MKRKSPNMEQSAKAVSGKDEDGCLHVVAESVILGQAWGSERGSAHTTLQICKISPYKDTQTFTTH